MIVRQVATISQSSLFLKYAATLYNQVSKQLKEAKNYCDVVPKLKKGFISQSSTFFIQFEKNYLEMVL